MKTSFTFPVLTVLLIFEPGVFAQPQSGTVLWTYDVGSRILSSPAMAPDGPVYAGSSVGLYAITNNGSTASNKWTFPASVAGSPAIGTDGTIYFVGGLPNALFAINPDAS